MIVQASAKNAVILDDDGKAHVRYRPVCPYCKASPTNMIYGATTIDGGIAKANILCKKCKKEYEVVISRELHL